MVLGLTLVGLAIFAVFMVAWARRFPTSFENFWKEEEDEQFF